MSQLITKNTLSRWASELGWRLPPNLPRYLVFSRDGNDSYRLEPLSRWLTRHRKKADYPQDIHSLSTKK